MLTFRITTVQGWTVIRTFPDTMPLFSIGQVLLEWPSIESIEIVEYRL